MIFDIRRFSINDGPGIRTTVFFKGCPLSCRWCHNPESQSFISQGIKKNIMIDNKELIKQEKCGIIMDTKSIMEIVLKDILFYDTSDGGVTISGGEPLSQPAFLKDILNKCRKKSINTCIDTSGYVHPDDFTDITPLADMFLYDIKFIDDKKHKEYTGSENNYILENLLYLDSNNISYRIRVPLIPGITDTKENINDIASFLKRLKNLRYISLLPFHETGNEKYKRFKIKNKCRGLKPLTISKINQIKEYFYPFKCCISIGE